jgi:hypothetical protein
MNAQAQVKQAQASIRGVLVQTICLDTGVPGLVRSPLCCEFLSMIKVNWPSWVLSVDGAGAQGV